MAYSDYLQYDPSSPSKLRWAVTRRGAKAGEVAGSLKIKDGYWRVKYFGKSVLAHRIVFELVTGNAPDGVIDHINRDKSDNTFSNLRVCTQSLNSCNRGMRSDNTSGVKGVSWIAKQVKWQAQIMLAGKQYYLGMFDRKDDAVEAVRRKREELHQQFAKH